MAKAAKLKVFVTAIGFHDAYVAAPSRAAALRAWGSTHDLFARGVASEVTDDALKAEPLARPGEVLRKLRGTREEQLAALPEDKPPLPAGSSAKPTKAKAQPPCPTPPSRETLDAAEAALDEAQAASAHELERLAEERRELDRRETAARDRAAKQERRLRNDLDEAEQDFAAATKRYEQQRTAFEAQR